MPLLRYGAAPPCVAPEAEEGRMDLTANSSAHTSTTSSQPQSADVPAEMLLHPAPPPPTAPAPAPARSRRPPAAAVPARAHDGFSARGWLRAKRSTTTTPSADAARVVSAWFEPAAARSDALLQSLNPPPASGGAPARKRPAETRQPDLRKHARRRYRDEQGGAVVRAGSPGWGPPGHGYAHEDAEEWEAAAGPTWASSPPARTQTQTTQGSSPLSASMSQPGSALWGLLGGPSSSGGSAPAGSALLPKPAPAAAPPPPRPTRQEEGVARAGRHEQSHDPSRPWLAPSSASRSGSALDGCFEHGQGGAAEQPGRGRGEPRASELVGSLLTAVHASAVRRSDHEFKSTRPPAPAAATAFRPASTTAPATATAGRGRKKKPKQSKARTRGAPSLTSWAASIGRPGAKPAEHQALLDVYFGAGAGPEPGPELDEPLFVEVAPVAAPLAAPARRKKPPQKRRKKQKQRATAAAGAMVAQHAAAGDGEEDDEDDDDIGCFEQPRLKSAGGANKKPKAEKRVQRGRLRVGLLPHRPQAGRPSLDLGTLGAEQYARVTASLIRAKHLALALTYTDGSTHYRDKTKRKKTKPAKRVPKSLVILDLAEGGQLARVALRGAAAATRQPAELEGFLKALLTSPSPKTCFNAKETLCAVFRRFPQCAAVDHQDIQSLEDIKIAAWLCEANETWTTCGPIFKAFLGLPWPDEQRALPLDALEADLRTCARAMAKLSEQLQERGLLDLFHSLEMVLCPVLAKMETAGIGVQTDYMTAQRDLLSGEVQSAKDAAHKIVGRAFALGSAKQLREILFEERELDPAGKVARITGKGNRSTDEEALRALQKLYPQDPLLDVILKFRACSKLQATFYDGLLAHVEDESLSCNWLQTGTASGRLACKNPNLQNVPGKAELESKHGLQLNVNPRGSFVARRDKVFVAIDFSQVELRILADLAGDPNLLRLFNDASEPDIFVALTCHWLGKTREKLEPSDRSKTKRIAYGIIYGMGPALLANELDVTVSDAKTLLRSFLSRFPGIRKFQEKCKQTCRQQGFVQTIMGRRRRFAEINSAQRQKQSHAERSCINFVIQGSGADIAKSAMIHVQDLVEANKGWGCRILLQIHDEMLFELDPAFARAAASRIAREMTSVVRLKVPLKVKAKIGASWGQMADLALR